MTCHSERTLSAYYFTGMNLCTVREHVRTDMQRLADWGYDAINLCIHEFQFDKQPRGAELVIQEAHRVGLKVIAVPSRICGMIAGWPPLGGNFMFGRPDLWLLQEDGSPLIQFSCGPVASLACPEIKEHMVRCTERILDQFDVDALLWDEVKYFDYADHHPEALKQFGGPLKGEQMAHAAMDILSACNDAARAKRPGIPITSFVYARTEDWAVDIWAEKGGFDEIGLDGRPGTAEDFAEDGVPHEKCILSNADRFLDAAERNECRSYALLETQNLNAKEAQITMKRLPEIIAKGFDHLSIYYHPLVDDPAAEISEEASQLLSAWRHG